MNRRDCLKSAMLAPLLGLPSLASLAVEANPSVRRLLLIELNGGNDGLNTVIPYADPLYAQLRPKIAIERDSVLQLDEHMGLHPALENLMPMFKSGELTIVQGVGYKPANRSHFRSIEIWDTATDPSVLGDEGWLSRLDIKRQFGRSFAADAIVIGRNPKPVSGTGMQPLVLADSASFVSESAGVQALQSASGNAALKRVLSVQREIESASHGLSAHRPQPAGKFPQGAFGRDAREAAHLLIGDPASPIVKIALTGFDTHVNQPQRQQALLRQLGDSLAALRQAFVAAGIWDQVLIVTYSEFGRRAQQNASNGTDHGKAAPHFVLGGRVKGGLLGERPNLASLDEGDIPATTDFRSLYNAVLGNWWGVRASELFDPQIHKPLVF